MNELYNNLGYNRPVTPEVRSFRLHQKYSHGSFYNGALSLCWTHSKIVRDIAIQIARGYERARDVKLDIPLIIEGALLHDIGFYHMFGDKGEFLMPYITHGEVSFDILTKEGYPPEICQIALTHVGVGISREKIIKEQLPLRPIDHLPRTIEEMVVCYADGFHTKGDPGFCSIQEIRMETKKHGQENSTLLETYINLFGIPDLCDIRKRFARWHNNFKKI